MAKKAVLIGITYPGTDNELKGCVNDVWRMHECLVDRLGFSPDDINVLIDTDPSYTEPTGENICASLVQLVRSAEPGDFLFVLYSGHGTRLPVDDDDTDDTTGYDECIVPCDMNLITDDHFKQIVCQVPEGCKITILSDSCHSGGLISSAEEQIGESTGLLNKEGEEAEEDTSTTTTSSDGIARGIRFAKEGYELRRRSLSLSSVVEMLRQKTGNEDINESKLRPTLLHTFGDVASTAPRVKRFAERLLKKVRPKEEQRPLETQEGDAQEANDNGGGGGLPENGILLSGCQSDQTSIDCRVEGEDGGVFAYGAFTNAILAIIEECGGEVSNRELVVRARELLESQGYDQRPGLYCSDQYADAPFAC